MGGGKEDRELSGVVRYQDWYVIRSGTFFKRGYHYVLCEDVYKRL